nr:homologous-pairing protein 2 homolog [Dromaius novaehollandiae]
MSKEELLCHWLCGLSRAVSWKDVRIVHEDWDKKGAAALYSNIKPSQKPFRPKAAVSRQEQLPAASDAELRGLDGDIAALSAEVTALQQSCRRMEAELKDLNGSLTTPEMAREIEELKKDCAGYAEKLARIKSATNHVTPEEKERVCSEQKLYCKEWRRRKRMATELLDAILEGYPKSKKQFFEEVGIETDEDHNVTLPAAV